MEKAYLLLEDGTKLEGESFGYKKAVAGEVVFTTSMVGYTESLTDPSYHGQILVFTYPLIGNYGIPKPIRIGQSLLANFESDRIWTRGVVVTNYIDTPSHYSSNLSLQEWLIKEKIPGICGIDTRALTQKLRDNGVMKGQIVFSPTSKGEFIDIDAMNLVAQAGISQPIVYKAKKPRFKKPILFYDCGVKYGMLRSLIKRDCDIYRVAWDYSPQKYEDFAAVVISNGPGDPVKADRTIETIRSFLHYDITVFGICLGNQILALAAGGKTYKLKYGHRSINQPVQDVTTKQSYMSTQNHGFAVDMQSLSGDWREWFVNLNDGSNEGIHHKSKPYFTIQFHAEANPGPQDCEWVFDYFVKQIEKYEKK